MVTLPPPDTISAEPIPMGTPPETREKKQSFRDFWNW
jgi:hypothetical protein